jgi:predicted DNA-binding transcriptional regulator AlpA
VAKPKGRTKKKRCLTPNVGWPPFFSFGVASPQKREESAMPRKKKQSFEYLNGDDLKVLTVAECAALSGLSLATAKRLMRDGKGPPTIQLSERRVGIRRIDFARWQEARLR